MKTKPYPFPFPVADTEAGPRIEWNQFTLTLRFTDYQNTDCEAVFDEVSHFELLSEDELNTSQFKYDGVVEVIDSGIIKNLLSIGEINEDERNDFHHIVIGFNEVGSYLSIVFKNLETNQPNQTSLTTPDAARPTS